MAIRTELCDQLGIEHPVILAPMAGGSGGALAAAVSRAGGLRLIGGSYGDGEWIEREFAAAGNARVGSGFITWSLARQPHLLDQALDRAPPAPMLSFGDFRPFAPAIREKGARLIVQIQTLEQAREAVGEGADVVIAQGTEAGGHGGARATLPLVPAVLDIAGGYPRRRGRRHRRWSGPSRRAALGAAGVLCGTAFYASEEALTHDNAKQAAVAASGDETERGSVFDIARGIDWPADWDLRTLSNDFTAKWADDTDGRRRHCRRGNRPRAHPRAGGRHRCKDGCRCRGALTRGCGPRRLTRQPGEGRIRFRKSQHGSAARPPMTPAA